VQGKSEQMMEYIKKLRACIKWLLEREDANLVEIGNISARLEAEGKEHSETGTKPELDPIIESDLLAQVQPNTWSGLEEETKEGVEKMSPLSFMAISWLALPL